MQSLKLKSGKAWSFSEEAPGVGLRIAAILLIGALFLLFAWVLVETSGLMTTRTGIREGYWVALVMLIGVLALKAESTWFGPILSLASTLTSATYSVNALVMLWPERPLLFWVLAAGWIAQIVIWVNRLSKSRAKKLKN